MRNENQQSAASAWAADYDRPFEFFVKVRVLGAEDCELSPTSLVQCGCALESLVSCAVMHGGLDAIFGRCAHRRYCRV